MRRVVITGMGIVSPVGTGVEHAWKNILAGKSGVKKITEFEVEDLASQIAGLPVVGTEPGQYNPDAVVDPREQRKLDKVITYGIVAADEAIKDAGLDNYEGDKERIGVSIGSGIGGFNTIYDNCIELHEGGPRRVSPFFIPKGIINMAAGNISIKYGFKGPNISVVTACATGAHSIGEAMRTIKYGDADIMICGGTEGAVSRIALAGFSAMRALSTRNDEPMRASRPWDKNRDGFIMAEGAGVLVLEEYEHAVARGAKIYAEVAGWGLSADAYHMTAPEPDGKGAAKVMQNALEDAGLKPEDIDYINMHGTSTPLGDIVECKAIKSVFGDHSYKMNISATKSMTGHLLGAAGAIEAIICVLSIVNDIVPPTINHQDDDMDENIDYNMNFTFNKAQERVVNTALSNTFGFGGHNACIILKKYSE